MKYWKLLVPALLVAVGIALAIQPTDNMAAPPLQQVYVSEPVVPEVSPPVRDLPPLVEEPVLNREINPRKVPLIDAETLARMRNEPRLPDPLLADQRVTQGRTPSPILNFAGIEGVQGYTPPDTIGDVGPNHYVQMVNVKFAIYDKSGNQIQAPRAINQLWTGSSDQSICANTSAGDPVVVYDSLADRWLLSQFANPNHICAAVSQTADPTGSYHLYQFDVGQFPDYFKFGVWPDAYLMSANESNYTAYAFDRVKMLAGQAATYQKFTGESNLLLPADIDGSTAPPNGTPGLFYTFKDNASHGGDDRLEIFGLNLDWVNTSNSSFNKLTTIPVSSFNYTVCGFFNFDCMPQPGTTQKLDSVSEWPMWRLQYRNFGSYQTLVGNFAIDVSGNSQAGIRWFELRNGGGGWSLQQEGTHAPDGLNRWLGSAAMDGAGNIALAYSAGDDISVYPGLRYATHSVNDAAGTMQSEVILQSAGGAQTGSNRWGDYSSLNIDPVDDCTFWYTSEYYPQDSSNNWHTRIGTFKMAECAGNYDFTLNVTPNHLQICTGETALITTSLLAIGNWSDPVTLSVADLPPESNAQFQQNPLTPTAPAADSQLSITNLPGGNYSPVIWAVAPTQTHTSTLSIDVLPSNINAPTLISPANQAVEQATAPAFQWQPVDGAADYLLEISSDNFVSIAYSATTTANAHVPTIRLLPETTYQWRVTAQNSCGAEATSGTFSFETQTAYCLTPNLDIPDDNQTGITSTLTLPDSVGTLSSLKVSLTIDHTWIGDLSAQLRHNGSSSALLNRPGVTDPDDDYDFGCSESNIDAIFSDSGAVLGNDQCNDAGTAISGEVQPVTPLNVFNGQSAAGDWHLWLTDSATPDPGSLVEWCIYPQRDGPPPITTDLQISKVAWPTLAQSGDEITYRYQITNSGTVSLNLSATDDKLGTVPLYHNGTPFSGKLLGGQVLSGVLTYTIQPNDLSQPLTNTFTTIGSPAQGLALTRTTVATVSMCSPVTQTTLNYVPQGTLYTGYNLHFNANALGSQPFSYTWALNNAPLDESGNTLDYQFTQSGIYTVAVTIANACSSDSAEQVVTINAPIAGQPDFSSSKKMVSSGTVLPGEQFTYTVLLQNTSDVSATASLTDTLPLEVELLPESATMSSGHLTATGNTVLWHGDIISGTPVTLNFAAQVTSTATSGTIITNTAQLVSGSQSLALSAFNTVNAGRSLSINNGTLYTRVPTVSLRYQWSADDTMVQFSNDGGFPSGDQTSAPQIVSNNPVEWRLSEYGNLALPRTVYARFRTGSGSVSMPVSDDIILDPNPPNIVNTTIVTQNGTLQLSSISVTSQDDISGVRYLRAAGNLQFSPAQTFTVNGPETTFVWHGNDPRVYIQAIDWAGNSSMPATIQLTDDYAVYLPLIMRQKP